MEKILSTFTESIIERKDSSSGEIMGLGPMNTISDFVLEFYDKNFREILGDDIMDRPLGSFSNEEMFEVLSKIFTHSDSVGLFLSLYKE